jgi:hypothetical protein
MKKIAFIVFVLCVLFGCSGEYTINLPTENDVLKIEGLQWAHYHIYRPHGSIRRIKYSVSLDFTDGSTFRAYSFSSCYDAFDKANRMHLIFLEGK